MKLNENIKQHIIFGLHYNMPLESSKECFRDSHENILFPLTQKCYASKEKNKKYLMFKEKNKKLNE